MKKNLFIISSAIQTKFGVYNIEQRLQQTYNTVKSVADRVKDPTICIVECSGIPLSQELSEVLQKMCHILVDNSKDKIIQDIHNNTPNWDVVKTVCEMVCYKNAFDLLSENGHSQEHDRIYKLSGRYELNDNFNLKMHERSSKIILAKKRYSQFSHLGDMVGIKYQYPSRLWSWPQEHHELIRQFYSQCLEELDQRLPQNRFADIEHLMYEFLPKDLLKEVNKIGVEGRIGTNGVLIND